MSNQINEPKQKSMFVIELLEIDWIKCDLQREKFDENQ